MKRRMRQLMIQPKATEPDHITLVPTISLIPFGFPHDRDNLNATSLVCEVPRLVGFHFAPLVATLAVSLVTPRVWFASRPSSLT